MDNFMNLQVPQSPEAEQSVLGSILIDSRCLPIVTGLVNPEDFYLQHNREIYETIYSMFSFSEPIDPVTVLEKMKQRGVAQEESDSDYLLQLMEITPTAANVAQYAKIVHDKALQRGILQAGSDITDLVRSQEGTADQMLESAERKIYGLRKGVGTAGLEDMNTILVKVFDRLTELSKSGQDFPGISTGLHDLDRKINGLNNSDLILIAARPAMGKSALALNMALTAAKLTKKTIAFFSLEMSREQVANRLIANESFVENQKLVTGKLTEEDWSKLSLAGAVLGQTGLKIDDNPAVTVAEMNAKCRRLENLGAVFVDYLQLMTAAEEGHRSDNRVAVVSDISRAMKIMAKELNVPVICLSQLSRANESRNDKRPMLSDLRESGSIEQDADIVMFIYRDEYYNPNTEDKGVAEIIVAKNRHGETGTVKLQWIPQFGTFADREWKHDGG